MKNGLNMIIDFTPIDTERFYDIINAVVSAIARVAQLAERSIRNAEVGGSIPPAGFFYFLL